MHIFQIWEHDLDALLQALDLHEQLEEKDRLSHGTSIGGTVKRKGGKRAAPAKDKKTI